MFSENDLDSAVTAGALTPEAAAALRTYLSEQRATPLVDEEQFRLVTGFNDIFVSIAGVLLLVAVAWIGGTAHPALGAVGVAGTAWGLAEYFTRVRRMALPSIIFLLAFVGGVFSAVTTLIVLPNAPVWRESGPLQTALAAACAAGAAWLHWRRFKVPITIAAGAGSAVGVALALLAAFVPEVRDAFLSLTFVGGLAVFAFAMWWDMSDPERRTRRSDVAFWLHLLAAPLIVHPVFTRLGVFEETSSAALAVVVLLLYIALGAVALAIDRRALMVSALAYVLYAMGALFKQFGAVTLNAALTALVIGSALLLLSAFWQNARAVVVDLLPTGITARLPPTTKVIAPHTA
jgi:MFS family permease